MQRTTTKAVNEFIFNRFVLQDDVGPFIPGTETQRLMRDLMQNFSGIYCGVMPDEEEGKLFVVRSVSTRKYFAKVRVK